MNLIAIYEKAKLKFCIASTFLSQEFNFSDMPEKHWEASW